MMGTLPKGLRCALAWSLALGIPLGIGFGIGLPWLRSLEERNGQIEQQRAQIQRYRARIATLPQLRAILDRERTDPDFKRFYYRAKTPALAGAQLQRRLQTLVRQAGAQLVNTQFLPGKQEAHPQKVRVRAQIRADVNGLLDILLALEQAQPFLFIDQMSIRSSARSPIRKTRRVRGRVVPNRFRNQGQLTVRLDVFGYALENDR